MLITTELKLPRVSSFGFELIATVQVAANVVDNDDASAFALTWGELFSDWSDIKTVADLSAEEMEAAERDICEKARRMGL